MVLDVRKASCTQYEIKMEIIRIKKIESTSKEINQRFILEFLIVLFRQSISDVAYKTKYIKLQD
jgi:hypothetical protein